MVFAFVYVGCLPVLFPSERWGGGRDGCDDGCGGCADLTCDCIHCLQDASSTKPAQPLPPPPPPSRAQAGVAIGPALEASGGYTVDQVRTIATTQIPSLRACYERALPANPTLPGGQVVVTIGLDATGAVRATTADGVHPLVSSCLAAFWKTVPFPPPASGVESRITLPILYTPQ
jgi:hypothetical protein